MSNILFHPHLPLIEALRIAHAQGERLVCCAWDGRVRMVPASTAVLNGIGAYLRTIQFIPGLLATTPVAKACKTQP